MVSFSLRSATRPCAGSLRTPLLSGFRAPDVARRIHASQCLVDFSRGRRPPGAGRKAPGVAQFTPGDVGCLLPQGGCCGVGAATSSPQLEDLALDQQLDEGGLRGITVLLRAGLASAAGFPWLMGIVWRLYMERDGIRPPLGGWREERNAPTQNRQRTNRNRHLPKIISVNAICPASCSLQ